ncbi:MAG: amidohydrolase [Hyphomicrobiaceae bacterium]
MFDTWFQGRKAEVERWLRTLHAQPELGFEEHRTAAFVADRLRDFGLDVSTGIGGTGVVGLLKSSKKAGKAAKSRTIGLRAELDALPIREQAAVDYRSTIEGKSHACGHDGHAVTLLTAAAYLSQAALPAGSIAFIFQPAEELLTGADAMIRDGLFQRFPCDEIYALHNLPGMHRGHVGVVNGGALASADEIKIAIHAKGTHGSAPHTGQDAVMAAATFLTTLQQTITRVTDSRDSGVISFGRIWGGEVGNVLPDRVEIEGTMRTHAAGTRETLCSQMYAVGRSVEITHGVRVEVTIANRVPVTLNHPLGVEAVLASARRVVGSDRIVPHPRPIMASEDFSRLLEKAPGAFFFIGQDGPYCHHPEFVFDTSIIPIGAAILADLALSRLAPSRAG